MATQKYTSLWITMAAFLFFCSACGYTTGVVQSDSKSYIRFSGNIKGAVVYIDDHAPFTLDRKSSATHTDNLGSDKLSVHYELEPGQYTITVEKYGEVVVKRKVLLGKDITKEIQVP